MRFELIELTDKNEIYRTYEIYKHCMFMPTEESFFRKIDIFLNDKSVKIYACVYENEDKGIIVISFIKQYEIEILGIAVDMSARHQGIGSYMIGKLADNYKPISLNAETDDDAVGFYRRNGFSVAKLTKIYNGETVTRYKCKLVTQQ